MLLGEPRPAPGQARSLLPELPLVACAPGRAPAVSGRGTKPPGLVRASPGRVALSPPVMALSPATWPTHRRGRPHRRAAGAAHRPWRMISKVSGCVYAVSRENGTCGAVPAPPGWRKRAKAVLGARFPVRCAGLATTESRSRRAVRGPALAAAARRGDLTGRVHEDGKKWTRVVASV
jgi:hypothetical protein